MSVRFDQGQKVNLPDMEALVAVDDVRETSAGWRRYLKEDSDPIERVVLSEEDAAPVEVP